MRSVTFWNVILYGTTEVYCCFGGTYFLSCLGQIVSQASSLPHLHSHIQNKFKERYSANLPLTPLGRDSCNLGVIFAASRTSQPSRTNLFAITGAFPPRAKCEPSMREAISTIASNSVSLEMYLLEMVILD